MHKFLIVMAGALACNGEVRSLDLKTAVELAAAQSPAVLIAKLETLESQINQQTVKSAYLPQLNGVIQGTYQTTNLQGVGLIFPGFPSRVGGYRTFNARPQATQTILDLSLLSSIRASKLATEQRKYDTETAREAIRLATVQLYLQLFEARTRIEAASARIKSAESLVQQVRDKESLGGASKLDLARNEQQLYAERYLRTQAERDAKVIETNLKETLSLAQTEELQLADPKLSSLVSIPQKRSELSAIDSLQSTQQLNLESATRERLPKLSAFGDFGLQGQGPDKSLSTYTVGATLTFPILSGGRIEADIAKAKIRIRQTEESRRRLTLQIDRESAEAQRELDAAIALAKDSELQRAAAAKTVELTKLRYDAGLATSTDTTTAQSILAEVEEQSIRARYTQQIATAKLAYAQGNLSAILP